jgi:hypothetical protein
MNVWNARVKRNTIVAETTGRGDHARLKMPSPELVVTHAPADRNVNNVAFE